MSQAFNPSTWDADTGGFLTLRPAWSTKWLPGQPELYRETRSQKERKKERKKWYHDLSIHNCLSLQQHLIPVLIITYNYWPKFLTHPLISILMLLLFQSFIEIKYFLKIYFNEIQISNTNLEIDTCQYLSLYVFEQGLFRL